MVLTCGGSNKTGVLDFIFISGVGLGDGRWAGKGGSGCWWAVVCFGFIKYEGIRLVCIRFKQKDHYCNFLILEGL